MRLIIRAGGILAVVLVTGYLAVIVDGRPLGQPRAAAPLAATVLYVHDIHVDWIIADVIYAHDVHAAQLQYGQLVLTQGDATGGKENIHAEGIQAQEIHAHDIHARSLTVGTLFAHKVH